MKRIRVGYIGDSPFIYSGFGVVAKAIMSRLDPALFEIYCLGTMYQHYPQSLDEIPALEYYHPCCIHDIMGFKASIDFLHHADPDVLFMIADPGTLRNRYSSMQLSGKMGSIPSVTYFPLEGAPFSPHILEQAKITHSPVTYTKWGADLINDTDHEGVLEADWVWHGTNHGPFRQYDEETRSHLRQLVGWGDRFVIGMVGVNKRTNRQPTYIEIASMLKMAGRDEAMVYLHCQEQGEMMMGGWELGWLIQAHDVGQHVQLKPNQAEHKFVGRPREGKVDIWDLPLPKSDEEAQSNLGLLSFVDILNLFDVYLDIASAHGWNLPACEAARCGVPIIMADDKFARSEIYGDVAYMLEPSAADYWHTGAVLPLVSPQRAIDAVIRLWDDSDLRAIVGKAGKDKFDTVTWETAAEKFTKKLISAHEYGVEMFGG
jgi:glycosyltransferase involved in cell wall biosynthesis